MNPNWRPDHSKHGAPDDKDDGGEIYGSVGGADWPRETAPSWCPNASRLLACHGDGYGNEEHTT